MHLVDVATGMQLKSMGQGEKCVPFVYQKYKQKMTLYKGPDALATRRAVAEALNPSLITALQRPRRATDKPDCPLGRKASTSGKPPALTSLCLGGLGVELRAL